MQVNNSNNVDVAMHLSVASLFIHIGKSNRAITLIKGANNLQCMRCVHLLLNNPLNISKYAPCW